MGGDGMWLKAAAYESSGDGNEAGGAFQVLFPGLI